MSHNFLSLHVLQYPRLGLPEAGRLDGAELAGRLDVRIAAARSTI